MIKAVLDNTKSLTPEWVNIKSNFLTKKIIWSKLKITDIIRNLLKSLVSTNNNLYLIMIFDEPLLTIW